MNTIEIIKQIDELTQDAFYFWHSDTKVSLRKYVRRKKKSNRSRTYHEVKVYDMIFSKRESIHISEVPLTDEIKNEALDKIRSMIHFK